MAEHCNRMNLVQLERVMLHMLERIHLAKECKLQSQVCVQCHEKKRHHQNLCPMKFGITKKPGTERNGTDENSLHKNTILLQLERK